jgi:uncharacterized OB-fold protein
MSSARYWRTRAHRYMLIGAACPQCGNKHLPPRDRCPDCHRTTAKTLPVSSPGQGYYFNATSLAAAGHEAQPLATAGAR